MCGHYHVNAAINSSLKRHKLVFFQLIVASVYERQTRVAVNVGISVSRKMLGTANDPVLRKTVYERNAHFTDQIGVGGESAQVYYRVRRIIVHVHRGREIHVYTHSPKLFGDDPCVFISKLRIAGSA